jgi:hypothetical protein
LPEEPLILVQKALDVVLPLPSRVKRDTVGAKID